MKSPIILTLGCLLASAQCSHAQPVAPAVAAGDAVAAPLTAAQILEKSRQTYAAFSIYKGSCSVVSDAVFAQGDDAPMQNVASASALVEFERGKSLSIEGVDAGGSPFKAQWTPSETWIENMRPARDQMPAKSERTDYKDEMLTANGVGFYRAVDGMLAGLSGFTGGVGSKIPNALVPDQFDLGNPFSLLGTAKLLPSRSLGNVACYVIEATSPELNSVTTYWIEQKTFLLRRMTEEIGERRFDDMPKVDGVEEPILRVAYSLNQYIFATTEAK